MSLEFPYAWRSSTLSQDLFSACRLRTKWIVVFQTEQHCRSVLLMPTLSLVVVSEVCCHSGWVLGWVFFLINKGNLVFSVTQLGTLRPHIIRFPGAKIRKIHKFPGLKKKVRSWSNIMAKRSFSQLQNIWSGIIYNISEIEHQYLLYWQYPLTRDYVKVGKYLLNFFVRIILHLNSGEDCYILSFLIKSNFKWELMQGYIFTNCLRLIKIWVQSSEQTPSNYNVA